MNSEQRKVIRERLREIEQRTGMLTPDAVLKDAKSKESPLHQLFEWDDRKAAAKWRLEQARDLIVTVHVKITTEFRTVSAPYYVRDPHQAHDKQGYVGIDTLRADPDKARAALVQEFARVASLLERARSLAMALGEEGRIDGLLEQTVGLRTYFEQQPPAPQQ